MHNLLFCASYSVFVSLLTMNGKYSISLGRLLHCGISAARFQGPAMRADKVTAPSSYTSQKNAAPQTYCLHRFPRSFVLLSSIVVRQLCLLHKVEAKVSRWGSLHLRIKWKLLSFSLVLA